MKKALFLIVIAVLAVVQVTVLDAARVWGVKPDLLLIAMVIASLSFDFKWAVSFAFICGALKDMFFAMRFGVNAVLFTLLAFSIYKLSRKIFIEDELSCLILAFAVAFANNLVLFFVFLFKSISVAPVSFFRIGLFGSIYTALSFLLIYRLVKPLLGNEIS